MRIDWQQIEHEYVTGKMTMETLIKKHGISESHFFRKAKELKFTEKRSKYREKAEEQALTRARAREAKRLERTNGNIGGALDRAARRINQLLNDEDTLFGRVLTGEDGVTEIRTRKADTKAIRDLTGALRDVVSALSLLTGDKADRDEGQAGVIILPEREDEA